MTDLSTKTALVYDNGLFVPLARRLSKAFGRVYFFSEWEEGFSTVYKACIGDGYGDIERVEDPWEIKNKVDLWVFPDLGHSGAQEELRSQGRRVWGAGKADEVELDRELFLRLLAKSGLDVPPHRIVVGIDALREYLIENDDKYIKISRYRGMMETTHWRTWALDSGLIDHWAVKWGPLGQFVRFVVCDPIETDLEIGGDSYNVRGQWPNTMLHGIEAKDKGYLGAVTAREDMPAQLKPILDAFGPILERYGGSTQWSMEVRVVGDKAFFTDPTLRGGLPSTASQLLLWKNFPEILWHGGEGELVEPEPAGQFSAECALSCKSQRETWTNIELPKILRDNAMLTGCCQVDGIEGFPPDGNEGHEIGWLVAIGDTPRETVDNLIALTRDLPDGVSAATDSLADVIKEIESAKEEGIEFTEEPMPPPEIVVASEA